MPEDQYPTADQALADTGSTGEAQGAPAPDAASTQQGDYQFNPQNYNYVFKGQTLFPRDQNHLRQLIQQGHGYSQRMEEMNKKQREFDEMGQRYEKYQKLDEALNTNPQFQAEVQNLVQRYQSGSPVPEQGQDANPYLQEISTLRQDLEGLKGFQQKYMRDKAKGDLERQFDELKKEFGHQDWEADDGSGNLMRKIAQHMHTNRIPNARDGYFSFMGPQLTQQAKMQGMEQAKETIQANHKAGKVGGSAPNKPQPSQDFDATKYGYNKLAEMATAAMENKQ